MYVVSGWTWANLQIICGPMYKIMWLVRHVFKCTKGLIWKMVDLKNHITQHWASVCPTGAQSVCGEPVIHYPTSL